MVEPKALAPVRTRPRPRSSSTASLLLAALLILAACESDSHSSTTGGATTSTSRPPASAPATTAAPKHSCASAAGYTPGSTMHHLTVAGATRDYLVHLPPHPSAGMPLVVDFHGAGSNMVEQDVYSGFDALADKDGFVVATPNGIDAAIRQWRFLGTMDDVDFAKAVADDLVANACVDAQRVFAAGISSGSAMSTSLACQASDRFAGFGLVAGDFYVPALCGAAKQRPIVIFHGTNDQVVPYNGGNVATTKVPVMPEEETAQAWAKHNGCTAGPRETTLGTEVVRLDWTGCRAPVMLYRIVGGGHTWPGAAINVDRLGATTHQISATEEMWNVFNRHD
jgi:polyhydroxybutyrate depolymerase